MKRALAEKKKGGGRGKGEEGPYIRAKIGIKCSK